MENLHKRGKKQSKRKSRPWYKRKKWRKTMGWEEHDSKNKKVNQHKIVRNMKNTYSNIYGIYDVKCDTRHFNAAQSQTMFHE